MGLQEREILNEAEVDILISRMTRQLIENHNLFENSILIGVQPRGIYVANRLKQKLKELSGIDVTTGAIDTTFFRDDFRRKDKPLLPSVNNIDFSIESKKIILTDDVLFSGRTVRAAMDALMTYGRPSSIELLVLVDRRFSRNLPIEANYVGKYIDTLSNERVEVMWKETENIDKVILVKK
ncbi:MAG: bifunctional pyr operon transcriptional regulator/uracil phosphoribosyltransferase PyrR [Flavobacteriales bacterium]|jgi:pyrimidine operon attenuation protein / uracil phosphoribosyltransferase|nr:bifunctional pyr operon transcriptional regulator/uracil phosphoribosyltransferase PyrR [Flavobacteriales bacterium]MDB4195445.1 bifunctional pyr operon transcriptional regulator/uracil phosphoribosyltransferase PyrR [Flavobacteriales bacterium]MDB9931847.1 bifunctional pyr operon transcriptional regulator/uracil phosphoribosyltransferase PyrR [Flavobacteriales bacterium]MDG1176598.1 bifunctional pyr operon transcriptional regulator/uracil phosphoribosyltransferase PyrR [Flavobacteriales bact